MSDDGRSAVGRFGALELDHPSVGKSCVVCSAPMLAGEVPSLISLAPADQFEAMKAAEGHAYNAVAGVAHERCAWPGEGS